MRRTYPRPNYSVNGAIAAVVDMLGKTHVVVARDDSTPL